jgi:hypothetical protein
MGLRRKRRERDRQDSQDQDLCAHTHASMLAGDSRVVTFAFLLRRRAGDNDSKNIDGRA